jgi:hypothetical protein
LWRAASDNFSKYSQRFSTSGAAAVRIQTRFRASVDMASGHDRILTPARSGSPAVAGSIAKQMAIILNYSPGGACARFMQGPQQRTRGTP